MLFKNHNGEIKNEELATFWLQSGGFLFEFFDSAFAPFTHFPFDCLAIFGFLVKPWVADVGCSDITTVPLSFDLGLFSECLHRLFGSTSSKENENKLVN